MRPPKLSRLQLALCRRGAGRFRIVRRWCGGVWWKSTRGRWLPADMLAIGQLLSLIVVTAAIPDGVRIFATTIGPVELWDRKATSIPRAVARYPHR